MPALVMIAIQHPKRTKKNGESESRVTTGFDGSRTATPTELCVNRDKIEFRRFVVTQAADRDDC